jgi:hypothetical protein
MGLIKESEMAGGIIFGRGNRSTRGESGNTPFSSAC